MKVPFISTAAIAQSSRQSIGEIQSELAKAQQELSTARHEDAGLALGYRAGRAVALRQEFDQLGSLRQTNALLSERFIATQDVLGQLVDGAQSIMATLLASTGTQNGPTIASQEAKSQLLLFSELLNTSFAGANLFGGTNSQGPPMVSYYASPATNAKQAVDADFLAAFGVPQGSPSVNAIDGASMQTFLDGTFTGNFEPGPWAANWSAASDQVIKSRVSISVTLETSVSANSDAYRKLAQSLVMVADLGAEQLNDVAFQVVADASVKLLGEAIGGLTSLQSTLAVSQESLQSANERMTLQQQVLTGGVLKLEGIDPFEASSRATRLLTQLETSYAVTARIQRLSLANYL